MHLPTVFPRKSVYYTKPRNPALTQGGHVVPTVTITKGKGSLYRSSRPFLKPPLSSLLSRNRLNPSLTTFLPDPCYVSLRVRSITVYYSPYNVPVCAPLLSWFIFKFLHFSEYIHRWGFTCDHGLDHGFLSRLMWEFRQSDLRINPGLFPMVSES